MSDPTEVLLKLMLLQRMLGQVRRKVKTPVTDAIKIKSIEALRAAMASENADVNAIIEGFGTPLLYTIRKSWYEGAEVLLRDYHADPNVCPSDQHSPLFYAAATDNAAIMRLLLAHGANVESQEGDDNVCIIEHICRVMHTLGSQSTRGTNVDSLKFILQYVAERPNLHHLFWRQNPSCKNRTSLHYATETPNSLLLYILLEYMSAVNDQRLSTFINLTDEEGNTPLHNAAKERDTASIDILLSHNASTQVRNNEQQKPEDVAPTIKKVLAKRRLTHL